jgi:hypothetical protein
VNPEAIAHLLQEIVQTPMGAQEAGDGAAETGFNTLADTPAGAQMMAALMARLDLDDEEDDEDDEQEDFDSADGDGVARR